MSTYRKLDRVPSSDVYAEAVKKRLPHSPAEIAAHEQEEALARAKRKAEPANVLLPRTRTWVAALPSPVNVAALLDAYPRIANMLAIVWPDANATSAYLQELLVDRRGNRDGFPPDVQASLRALAAYHEELHPTVAPPGWWLGDKRV